MRARGRERQLGKTEISSSVRRQLHLYIYAATNQATALAFFIFVFVGLRTFASSARSARGRSRGFQICEGLCESPRVAGDPRDQRFLATRTFSALGAATGCRVSAASFSGCQVTGSPCLAKIKERRSFQKVPGKEGHFGGFACPARR